METFAIICETCRARLKVRLDSAIGEIHPCPKCGSMVQVVRPTDATVPAPPPSTAAVVVVPTFEFSEPQPAPAPTVAVETSAPAAPAVAAMTNFSPIVLWGSGAAILLVAGGVALGMWLRGNVATVTTSTVAAQATETKPEAAAETIADAPADEAPVENEPVAVEPAAAAPQEKVSAEAQEAKPPFDKLRTSGQAARGAEQAQSPAQQPEVVAESPSKAPPQERVAALPIPAAEETTEPAPLAADKSRAPVLKFDPLAFDPSELTLGGSNASEAPADDSIPEEGEVVVSAENGENAAASVDLPPPANTRTIYAQLGPIPNGALRAENLAQKIGLSLKSFEANDVTLAHFVEMLSDLSDAPITLEPAELELAGVSARKTVSTKASDATLEKLLRETLAKHRLELAEAGGKLRVVVANGERRGNADYDVQDLVGSSDGKQLVALIQRFVAPATWQGAGGAGILRFDGGKLHIEQSQSVRHQVLIFCERLRMTRGLPTRSRYPAERLSIESPYKLMGPKLAERTTFTFLPWTRLADVMRHWQEASGLTVLVDWSALADAELSPSTPVTCSAIDRAWGEALDGILEPLGLAWWAADGQTIQITTREAVRGVRRIEFYTVPESLRKQFLSNAALVESLLQELLKAGGANAASDPPSLELDEAGGRLIVLAAPEAQRFLTQRLSDAAK